LRIKEKGGKKRKVPQRREMLTGFYSNERGNGISATGPTKGYVVPTRTVSSVEGGAVCGRF